MSTNKQEFLSALLDDEAGTFEQRRLLDELKKDDELAHAFTRYALIGEAMRANASGQRSALGVSLLSRIQDELEGEPAYTGETVASQTQQASTTAAKVVTKSVRPWRNIGFALAAGIAALAVGGVLFLQPAMHNTTSSIAANDPVTTEVTPKPVPVNAANALVADAATEARIQQVGSIDPQTRDMLKQYVAQHVKYASTTVIAPSVRAVSYVNER